ncbi:MAG: glycosyltransferase family 2 protein, partial [Pyrinomonadaceae bacterium]
MTATIAQVFARLTSSKDREYRRWIKKYDRPLNEDKVAELKAEISKFTRQPLISVLMPVYNSPEIFLRKAIESVRQQVYSNWELCIADDRSTHGHVRRILNEYGQVDCRIKAIFREKNGHISAATNSALSLANGEFVALLDHDDELHRLALFHVIREINEHPDVCLIYSDEDKIDGNGKRYDPYFKPDWNPDLFLSQNFISHLGVYRTDLVRSVGGFREGFEGSQDYDLALCCIEQIDAHQIRHTPYVLYHWRAIEGSTSLLSGEKSYAVIAARKAIASRLERTGQSADVVAGWRFYHRVRYHVTDTPRVQIISFGKDEAKDVLVKHLNAIGSEYDLLLTNLVIDSGQNFADALNKATEESKSNLILFLNNSLRPTDSVWLSELISHALRPCVGIVSGKIVDKRNKILHAGLSITLEREKNEMLVRSNFAGFNDLLPGPC